MDTISIILNVALFLFLAVLYSEIKELRKELNDIGRWSVYLETATKDAKILVPNPEKGEHGEYEVNKKLSELLK